MSKQDLVKREKWKKKLQSWQQSGLSVQKWCKENKVNHSQFYYWKGVLKTPPLPALFKELKEESCEPLELELRLGDIIISFPKGCTPTSLELCLKTLRASQCLP